MTTAPASPVAETLAPSDAGTEALQPGDGTEAVQADDGATQGLNDLGRAIADAETRLSEVRAQAQDEQWFPTTGISAGGLVLAFGLAVIFLAAFRVQKRTAESMLRMFGTMMVITMASFVVVIGINSEEMAAALGLLGTIAGYLLGRPNRAEREGLRAEGIAGHDITATEEDTPV